MLFQNAVAIESALRDVLEIKGNEIKIIDDDKFRERCIDRLVYNAVFHESEELRYFLCWLIRKAAANLIIYPTSMQGLYEAIARGEVANFTLLAISVRALSYDVARACFQAAKETATDAFIFAFADAATDYNVQPPIEYATCILAAAIRERHQGPIFLQADHIQLDADHYQAHREDETDRLKGAIEEAMAAGFFNIDLNTSSLVDLSRPTLAEQQQQSYRECAELAAFTRQIEPGELSVNMGAEILALGNGNSTAGEFRAFMDGFVSELNIPGDKKALSKITLRVDVPPISTDVAKVNLELLKELGEIARREFGLCVAVRSESIPLSEELFDRYPENNISEVHLPNRFEELIFHHEAFSSDLKKDIFQWLMNEFAGQRKPDQSDEEFFHAFYESALSPFKQKMWDLPPEQRAQMMETVQAKFTDYLNTFRAAHAADLVRDTIDIEKIEPSPPLSGYEQTAEATFNVIMAEMGGTKPVKIGPL